MKRYDLIVIGAGPAGLSAATEAASYVKCNRNRFVSGKRNYGANR